MKDFKIYFNPLVAIARLTFSISCGGMTCLIIYLLYRDYNTNGLKEYLAILLGAAFFGALFHMFFKSFITTTKNYLITDNFIQEFNLLTFKTKTIEKKDINGFSTSVIPYRIGNFKQIIIYMKDGSKIEMMQFAYVKYKKIKPTLDAKKYNYLGHEAYVWKWLNSRVYKYDN